MDLHVIQALPDHSRARSESVIVDQQLAKDRMAKVDQAETDRQINGLHSEL